MPTFEIGGTGYYFAEQQPQAPGGNLQTVVLVHGAGGNSSHWAAQLSGLGREYRVIAPDLPGHGRSGGEARDSIAAYREFIRDLAGSCLLNGFYLGGHSMGGAVALDFALHYPELLAGIILIGTGSRLRVLPAILESFKNALHYGGLASLAYGEGAPGELLKRGVREMRSVKPIVWYRDFSACNNFDVTSRLAEIRIPALVVTGDRDVMTPPKYARSLEAGIPGAVMEVVGGAGHMVMLEKPEQLNQIIANFLHGRNQPSSGGQSK
ncbi:MAG: alpha/beta hydrolase [Firmicutes bacterium]|nr:alpha/beta hydrolase [Bacillota bacterium]